MSCSCSGVIYLILETERKEKRLFFLDKYKRCQDNIEAR